MCGIAGYLNISENTAKKMNASKFLELLENIRHRGPDDIGYFEFMNKLWIGMVRLAIIDPEHGHQPLIDNRRKTILVFNGEIYNYLELRDELTGCGYSFRTKTDTEVILHGYAEWGNNVFEKLNGMYAIAILDLEKEKLILSRDRLGQKPLYYSINSAAKEFVFASELRFIENAVNNLKSNFSALRKYFLLSYIAGEDTIYKNVKCVHPATILEINLSDLSLKEVKYWRLKQNPDYTKLSFDEAKKTLFELLSDSVKRRLIADVPIGIFLSSGVDSSIIASIAASHKTNFKALTVSYGNDFNDESNIAQKICNYLKLDHEKIHISPDTVKKLLIDIEKYTDQPFADPASLPLLAMSIEASHYAKVFLTGDGGDESFIGYQKYKILPINKLFKRYGFFLKPLINTFTTLFPANTQSSSGLMVKRIKKALKIVGTNEIELITNMLIRIEENNVLQDRETTYKELQHNVMTMLNSSKAKTELKKMQWVDLSLVLPEQRNQKLDKYTMMD